MNPQEFKKEIVYLGKRVFFLDIAAYLISVPFVGFTLSMLIGLLLGTLALFVNLVILNVSVKKIVWSSNKTAKAKAFLWYILRLLVLTGCIFIAINTDCINIFGVIVPPFFPKIIYYTSSIMDLNKKI